ncbi:MAG: DUF779 domain-containing protein [Pseudomonadota bacterium]
MQKYFSGFDIENPTAGAGCDGHVAATDAALALLKRIQREHGQVSIHHEGGYANGTNAMCLLIGELRVGDMDILLGTVRGAPVFVYGRNSQDWDDRQFVLDAIDGVGRVFSLDSGTGKRFFVRSQPFQKH